ncbi:uncharacterized protein LY89DRAFT_144301 [Mollisia scopiformis]|uniref:Uncharacterized protein n=1 Tax=Mollisia scopiformis TaxID=149040 RepID=A0A194X199_MOLSC|nr:uncharacterized protein LY89DRAFT_144301 [Mollisia scopiformis]KUJ13637.1 hypothetical protein LY89DRAFT_144301 [Mollisia scopiformis]
MQLRIIEATKHAEELEPSEQKPAHNRCEDGRMKAQITELEAACQQLKTVGPQLDIAQETIEQRKERGEQIEVGSDDGYDRSRKEICDHIKGRAKVLSALEDHRRSKSKLLRRLQENRTELERLEEKKRNREGILALMEAQESHWSVDKPVVTLSSKVVVH